MQLRARPVSEKDIDLLFRWLNDPETRKMSFSQKPVPFEVHKKWFESVLESRKSVVIIECQEHGKWKAVGQVRLDEDDEIHISVAPEFRNKGLGTAVLRSGIDYFSGNTKIKKIYAHIKPDNLRSVKIFKNTGFKLSRKSVFKGHECLEYVLESVR